MPDLADIARVFVAVAFFGAQTALVLTGSQRSEGAFAFRMFNQSSLISASLSREVSIDGRVSYEHVKGGEWTAKDRYGIVRRFAWRDRVTRPELRALDRSIHASYGIEAQSARFRAALSDVALHLNDDAETTKLILDISGTRNGRPISPQHIEVSVPR